MMTHIMNAVLLGDSLGASTRELKPAVQHQDHTLSLYPATLPRAWCPSTNGWETPSCWPGACLAKHKTPMRVFTPWCGEHAQRKDGLPSRLWTLLLQSVSSVSTKAPQHCWMCWLNWTLLQGPMQRTLWRMKTSRGQSLQQGHHRRIPKTAVRWSTLSTARSEKVGGVRRDRFTPQELSEEAEPIKRGSKLVYNSFLVFYYAR